jgi:thioester reductase-like protein
MFKALGTKTLPEIKIEYLQADLSKPRFNLSPLDYTRLANQVTYIFHNAWSVDFNQSISSFEPLVRSCYHLIKFANKSPQNPSINFLSSVSVADKWRYKHDGIGVGKDFAPFVFVAQG